jgi:hypothetical protein
MAVFVDGDRLEITEEIILRAPGLSKSKKTRDKKHHNYNSNDVKNIAHVNFSFFRFVQHMY